MRQLILFACLFFTFIAHSQKQIELSVAVTTISNKSLAGITVEFRDKNNGLLESKITDEDGKVVYSINPRQTTLVMVFDKEWNYSPANGTYYEKEGVTAFNFSLEDISSKVINYKKNRPDLRADTTIRDLLNDCLVSSSEPVFEALAKYLQQTLRYPEFALDHAIGGRVFVRFIIDENGEIWNLEIKRGMDGCKECDLEVLRVFSLMPKWKPATCDDKPVPMYYNLPIKFTPG